MNLLHCCLAYHGVSDVRPKPYSDLVKLQKPQCLEPSKCEPSDKDTNRRMQSPHRGSLSKNCGLPAVEHGILVCALLLRCVWTGQRLYCDGMHHWTARITTELKTLISLLVVATWHDSACMTTLSIRLDQLQLKDREHVSDCLAQFALSRIASVLPSQTIERPSYEAYVKAASCKGEA